MHPLVTASKKGQFINRKKEVSECTPKWWHTDMLIKYGENVWIGEISEHSLLWRQCLTSVEGLHTDLSGERKPLFEQTLSKTRWMNWKSPWWKSWSAGRFDRPFTLQTRSACDVVEKKKREKNTPSLLPPLLSSMWEKKGGSSLELVFG